MKRQSYQRGTVVRIRRKNRPDVWVLRYYEYDLFGHHVQRACTFATIEECPTKAEAERRADSLRQKFNDQIACVYFENLVNHYLKEDFPQRGSTQPSYRSNLKRLKAKWGHTRLDWMCSNPLEIQRWLKELKTLASDGTAPRELSHKSKKNLKALLHRLFECAMAWGFIQMQRNPIDFVQLRGGARRARRPRAVLTLKQCADLLADRKLPSHVKVMIQIAMMTGLRISEILGLRWEDVDFRALLITVRRSVVGPHQDLPKSAASADIVPLHKELADVLQRWNRSRVVVKGWLFGNITTERPFHRDALQKRYLAPAGLRAGIIGLGWHTFRHTYRALLRELETPLEVQQYLLRHASITTTMEYGKFGPGRERMLREANARVVEMLPKAVGAENIWPTDVSARERRRLMRGEQ